MDRQTKIKWAGGITPDVSIKVHSRMVCMWEMRKAKMTRHEIINALIQKFGYRRYLEIGCRWGQCFDQVICGEKIGVDPDLSSVAHFKMTSNQFFALNRRRFDLVFIDGLHLERQVDRDIKNALFALAPGGCIVLHDCDPKTEHEQREIQKPSPAAWTGTVWRSFVKLRQNPELEMFVVDTDHGCGIIRRGKQQPASIPENPTYSEFDKNREEWLNLISVDFFVESFITDKTNKER